MSRQTLEIESLAEFDRHISGATRLSGWFVQSVDLTERVDVLAAVDPSGAVFLGCVLLTDQAVDLRRRGALLFPRLPDVPFDPYRGCLYDAAELFGSGRYRDSSDAAIFAWSKGKRSVRYALATALHDHAISDALDEATARIKPHDIIGIMGGHNLVRGQDGFRAAARLGMRLAAAGRTVLTGGGPGAMEAANLGAWMSPYADELDAALDVLAEVPSYRPSLDDWARTALAVRDRWPNGGRSFGIPTWFYGHEPPNAFAAQIAKYFANALREDTLLTRCRGGVIALSGAAGTVQEIFQASTENYYAAAPVDVAPMVLVGIDYWTTQVPAWPLLERLGEGREMGRQIHLVDTTDEAAELLLA